jgi:hypothetical protein
LNLYVPLSTFKTSNGITATDDDAEILRIIEAVSREVDDYCGRHFYTKTDTRYFSGTTCRRAIIDDCLSISAAHVDVDWDASYSQAWTQGTDFYLSPANTWPKMRVVLARLSTRAIDYHDRYLRLTGTWGYGDGQSASPWKSLGVTGTLDSTSDTTLALSAAGGVSAGHTLKLGSEQVYVESISGTTATVERGVNGTTAAAQAAVAVYAAKYPANVSKAVLMLSAEAFNTRQVQGLRDVMIGEYRETYALSSNSEKVMQQSLSILRRVDR